MRIARNLLVLAAWCGLVACGSGADRSAQQQQPAAQRAASAPTGPSAFKIVFLGDSLTAGLGLLSEDTYPAVIGRKFADEGYSNVEIINAGVSGDTTAGAVRRLPEVLESDTKIVVVALGGNDALRALTTQQTHDNLATILDT